MSATNGKPPGIIKVLAFINVHDKKSKGTRRELEVVQRKHEVETFDYRSLEAKAVKVTDCPTFIVVSDGVELYRTSDLSELTCTTT